MEVTIIQVALDLHIHSEFSIDSALSISDILRIAKKRGLSGIAITDHNTVHGGLVARKNNSYDLGIIVGSEVSTELGDIIGLFLTEDITSNYSSEVIDQIHDQNGLAVLPHPSRNRYEMNSKAFRKLIRKIDCIESFNSRCNYYENLFAQSLAKRSNKPQIAGSDAHFPQEIGRGITIIDVDENSLEEYKKAIVQNDTTLSGIQTSNINQSRSKILKSIRTGDKSQLLLDFGSLFLNLTRDIMTLSLRKRNVK